MILDVEALDPGWIQVVHNDFSHTDASPLATNLLIEDNHTVSAGKCIHIR